MPNHVTTRCIVTGPTDQITRFRAEVLDPQAEEGREAAAFLFDRIIPMPSGLKAHEKIESGYAEQAQKLLVLQSAGAPFDPGGLAPYEIERIRADVGMPTPTHIADVAKAWLKEYPEHAELGRQRLRNVVETGYVSWYPWSINNWGTKWDSYEVEIDDTAENPSFTFQTAWSFPTPIFEKLAEMFPALTFDCVTFDEGWNFAGSGQFGHVTDKPFAICDATKELYREVYGEDPPVDEDEEEGEE